MLVWVLMIVQRVGAVVVPEVVRVGEVGVVGAVVVGFVMGLVV